MSEYRRRVFDEELKFRLAVFPAVLITGPKGCGKTRTASEIAKTKIRFQDEDRRSYFLQVANSTPSLLLEAGSPPILFDEWQDAPKIWGAIRSYADEHPDERGRFILTGSCSKRAPTPHTGTLRITELEMRPMSLFESGDSNGAISLRDILDHPGTGISAESPLAIDDLLFLVCRGGWPMAVNTPSRQGALFIARDLFRQIIREDISSVDGKRRDPIYAQAVLRSYARNLCAPSSPGTMLEDCYASAGMSRSAFEEYSEALRGLYLTEEIPSWGTGLRSRTAMRSTPKKNMVDPSIAAAALDATPERLKDDFRTFGLLFESLCVRDIRAYSLPMGGRISYYRDRYGLEADMVLTLDDGRYALIEVKLGDDKADEASANLLRLERRIKDRNEQDPAHPIPMPTARIVLTGAGFAYLRTDGTYVVPIGTLRD